MVVSGRRSDKADIRQIVGRARGNGRKSAMSSPGQESECWVVTLMSKGLQGIFNKVARALR
ncbi:hypothetical protein MF4836_14320 [Pseudomonas sp. MF4836]|nr:hypothetical protein MF4836_14320 [Pseudomonas sp. MF4836]